MSRRRETPSAASKLAQAEDDGLEVTPGAGGNGDAPPRRGGDGALAAAARIALFCYLSWLVLLSAGMLAYEGEPVRVKSKDLPLHWFDVLFRTAGALLLFALWAARAAAAHMLPSHFDRRANLVWVPAGLYGAQALLRMAIYQLHVAGYIFAPRRWARDNLSHPPHVMSDHILLAAAVHGGLACEALLPLLNWQHVAGKVRGRTFMRAYSTLAAALAALVAGESYFTARYFHPPTEIVLAAALGLALFQAPLLLYAARAFAAQSGAVQAVSRRAQASRLG